MGYIAPTHLYRRSGRAPQRRRIDWIGVGLVAFIICVYAVTIGMVVVNALVGSTVGVVGSVVFLAVITFTLWSASRPGPNDPPSRTDPDTHARGEG